MKQILFFILLAVFVAGNSFAQDKPTGNGGMFYSTSDGTTPTDQLVNPPQTKSNPEVDRLTAELRTARLEGSSMKMAQIQNRLNEISGASKVTNPAGNEVMQSIDWTQMDMNVSTVLPWNNWGSALGTVEQGPMTGRIFAASTQFAGGTGDTMTLLHSTNGGVTWVRLFSTFFVTNTDYNANECDLEIAYDGTNTWVYIVAGYTDLTNSTKRSWLWRYNATANSQSNTQLVFTPNPASNNYYNPRICSDTPVWAASAYVYIIASCDSTYSGTSHWLKQKYCFLTTPFGTLTVTYVNPNSGSWFYNSTNNVANRYLASDIAYFNAPTPDRVMTSFQVNYGGSPLPSGYNIVLAWSDNFGTSNTGNMQITEANISSGARLAFTNGTSQRGILVYQRQFSGADWDPFFRHTTNGGGVWSAGDYVDASADRQRGQVSVYAPLVSNNFRVGYVQQTPANPYAFVAKFNTTTNNFPTADLYNVSGAVIADTVWGVISPGARTGGGDDCLSIWRGVANAFTYCSYLCATTTGITPGVEVPVVYNLEQNYPNPFNPTTNIKFGIPNSGLVKLIVFDVTGKQVGSLVDQNMNAGSYTVDFDASSLSSGIYFYTITAGSFTDTKKMVLVK